MGTDLINWGELSRHLSGSRQNIRKNKIPKRYKDKVEKLIKLIEKWKAEN
jgi:hypothetical protein